MTDPIREARDAYIAALSAYGKAKVVHVETLAVYVAARDAYIEVLTAAADNALAVEPTDD